MNVLNLLHAAIRRNLFWLERLLIAGGLTVLLSQLLAAQSVYPIYWDTVILAGVFISLLFWPTFGYFALLLAALYPLGSISIYVAVLVLAIALIGQHWFIPNLGLVVLTLSAPFLNGLYLAWLVPLLGGLWWGQRGGLLAGLFGALWGKIIFGLIGLPPDWLRLAGLYPDLAPTLLRFAGLSSWQVLETLTIPLISDSTTALYHVLQIAIWAFTGWWIGRLMLEDRVQYHRPRTTIGLLAAGTLSLAFLQFLLFVWLGFESVNLIVLDSLLPTALLSLITAIFAEWLFHFFEHPWSIPVKTPPRSLTPIEHRSTYTAQAPTASDPAERTLAGETQPPSKKTDEDHLIMIELD